MRKLAFVLIGILGALAAAASAEDEQTGLAKLFSSFRLARSADPAKRRKIIRKIDCIKKRY